MLKMKNYKYIFAGALAVSVITLSGCVAPGAPGYQPTTIDDSNTTTQIKAALVNEAMYKVNQIRVETVNGVVTLSGVVQSRPEAERVVEMTKTIKGVKEIRDVLEVRP
jgi:osmotically-inducible protein OsmY